MKALIPDFLTSSNEHIKVLTRPQFYDFIRTMVPNEEVKLYIETDRQTHTAEYAIAIRKNSWNDSIYYQIGGFGYMITTINLPPENIDEDFVADVNRALDSFDISDKIGVVVADTPSHPYSPQINQIRQELIGSIVAILHKNNLGKIDLDGIIPELTYVLWHDDYGKWHDSPVVAVSLHEKGIAIDVANNTINVEETLYYYYGGTYPLAFNNLYWLDSIRDNIIEAITATRNIHNNTQLSLLKKWNEFLNENSGDEPSFANVSVRYKDGTVKDEQTISLIDLSDDDNGLIIHYAKSLQELIVLAAPNTEISAPNFIIINLNYYSEDFEEPQTED